MTIFLPARTVPAQNTPGASSKYIYWTNEKIKMVFSAEKYDKHNL